MCETSKSEGIILNLLVRYNTGLSGVVILLGFLPARSNIVSCEIFTDRNTVIHSGTFDVYLQFVSR
jgi:hypothetical protein